MLALLICVSWLSFWLAFKFLVELVIHKPVVETKLNKVSNFIFETSIFIVTIYAILNWI